MDALSILAREKAPEIRNHHICAALVHKHKEIISIGYARRKSHPLQARFGADEYKIYLHAEVDALIKGLRLGYKPSKKYTQVYIARTKKPFSGAENWIPGLGKPCPGCISFIDHCNISQVFYTR